MGRRYYRENSWNAVGIRACLFGCVMMILGIFAAHGFQAGVTAFVIFLIIKGILFGVY